MNRTMLVLIIWCMGCAQRSEAGGDVVSGKKARERFVNNELAAVLQDAEYAASHVASEGAEDDIEEGVSAIRSYIRGTGRGEEYPSEWKEVLGILRGLAKHGDHGARGFGLVALGVAGDRASASEIMESLRASQKKAISMSGRGRLKEEHVAGHAALALGVLESREHAGELVALVEGELPRLRGYGAVALGYMKALEHAGVIARVLQDQDHDVRRWAAKGLAIVGAREYAEEILAALKESDAGTKPTMMYSIVRLGASECAIGIRELLDDERVGGVAAKVLGLLGASEYAKDIVKLLNDKSALVRRDAALALGFLGEKANDREVAKVLEDREGFVRLASVQALLLMKSDNYKSRIVQEMRKHKAIPQFDYHEYDSVVIPQLNSINERLREEWKRLLVE